MKRTLLLGYALAAVLLTNNADINAQQTNRNTSLHIDTYITDADGESTMNFREDGHRYKIRMTGSRITEMFVDDERIAEENYSKYADVIKRIQAQIEKDRKQAEKDRAQAVKDLAQAEKDRLRADKDRQQADRDREQADKDRAQAERDRQQADNERLQAEQERRAADADRDQADKDRLQSDKDRQAADRDRVQADKDRAQAEKDRQQAEKDRMQADRDRTQAEKDRKQAELDRKQAEVDRKNAEEDRKKFDEFLSEIVNEKIVESKSAITSITLDDKEFTVNGTTQPDSVHTRFKLKYLKSAKNRIEYRRSGGYSSMRID